MSTRPIADGGLPEPDDEQERLRQRAIFVRTAVKRLEGLFDVIKPPPAPSPQGDGDDGDDTAAR